MIDLSSYGTFDYLKYWLEEIRNEMYYKGMVVLLGNKVDIKREKGEPKKENLNEIIKKYKLIYFETSAKTGENIEESILCTLRIVLSDYYLSFEENFELKNEKKLAEIQVDSLTKNSKKFSLFSKLFLVGLAIVYFFQQFKKIFGDF